MMIIVIWLAGAAVVAFGSGYYVGARRQAVATQKAIVRAWGKNLAARRAYEAKSQKDQANDKDGALAMIEAPGILSLLVDIDSALGWRLPL